uniref:Uncharacterized protein n=1 Tax=Arundo donax TaxID=35708 RepID=A0A0A9AWW7_ARUDO
MSLQPTMLSYHSALFSSLTN